jgi:hypothetical protein
MSDNEDHVHETEEIVDQHEDAGGGSFCLLLLARSFVDLYPIETTTAKRGRGRPKGSKNKSKTAPTSTTAGASTTAAATSSDGDAPVKRKRGRPPKVCESRSQVISC